LKENGERGNSALAVLLFNYYFFFRRLLDQPLGFHRGLHRRTPGDAIEK
jgi:hypothetical protein